MNELASPSFQKKLILFAVIFAGVVCLIGAVRQMQTGETFGLSGKGKVFRSEEPGYFAMVFWVRLFLGIFSLGIAVFAMTRLT